MILRQFIRTEKHVSLTSTKLAEWVNENLHVKLGIGSPLRMSSRTSPTMALNINDGHERVML